jgi:hypothetical protein
MPTCSKRKSVSNATHLKNGMVFSGPFTGSYLITSGLCKVIIASTINTEDLLSCSAAFSVMIELKTEELLSRKTSVEPAGRNGLFYVIMNH